MSVVVEQGNVDEPRKESAEWLWGYQSIQAKYLQHLLGRAATDVDFEVFGKSKNATRRMPMLKQNVP